MSLQSRCSPGAADTLPARPLVPRILGPLQPKSFCQGSLCFSQSLAPMHRCPLHLICAEVKGASAMAPPDRERTEGSPSPPSLTHTPLRIETLPLSYQDLHLLLTLYSHLANKLETSFTKAPYSSGFPYEISSPLHRYTNNGRCSDTHGSSFHTG